MPTLSLLICHLPERVAFLARLHARLHSQLTPAVEVLIDDGDGTVGAKRNRLLARATGDFTAFIDDDDLVTVDYVPALLRTIRADPAIDCCSLQGLITVNGQSPRRFEHSLQHATWFEAHGVYYRPPNHLNAIARRHTQAVAFPDQSHGEDHVWSMAIRPRLHQEAWVPELLYEYDVRNPKVVTP